MQSTTGAEIGHTSVTARLSKEVKAVLYVPITKAMSDAEKNQVYRNLELTIKGLDFGQLVGLDVDYSRYMADIEVKENYQSLGLLLDAKPQCDALRSILRRAHFGGSPIYILRDSSPVSEIWTDSFKRCLSPNFEVFATVVRTKSDLVSLLLELQTRPKGILVNTAYSVYNYEIRSFMDVNQIHDIYRSVNRKHVDMAPFKAHSNLSFALIPSGTGDQVQLYVNIKRLDDLDASLVYKNLFRSVTGTISSRTKDHH